MLGVGNWKGWVLPRKGSTWRTERQAEVKGFTERECVCVVKGPKRNWNNRTASKAFRALS